MLIAYIAIVIGVLLITNTIIYTIITSKMWRKRIYLPLICIILDLGILLIAVGGYFLLRG